MWISDIVMSLDLQFLGESVESIVGLDMVKLKNNCDACILMLGPELTNVDKEKYQLSYWYMHLFFT